LRTRANDDHVTQHIVRSTCARGDGTPALTGVSTREAKKMPRRCTVCQHTDRAAIDRALVAGSALAALSRDSHVSEDALARHAARHLPAALAKAQAAADVAHGDDLLAQVRDLQQTTLRLLERAEAAGKLTAAVLAVGQARQNIELMAKLVGELQQEGTVNILVAPEWLAVRAALLTALAPYPEARTAVATRLAELEAGDGARG
jgi:hypothetical protein